MTKTEILALQPGRELDALVAERLFNARWWKSNATGKRTLFMPDRKHGDWFTSFAAGTESLCRDWDYQVPPYSTDIAAAWQVVEAVTAVPRTAEESKRAVNTKFVHWWQGEHLCCYSAAEAAEAICKAALFAKLESGEV